MTQGESHPFGGSSLDLTNHYYRGPETEKLRFVQYCEDQLSEQASNDSVSSAAFLNLLNKYCYHRNMRGSVCRAAESSTFNSLPIDIQLAFVSERCSGTRENRLVCLSDLTDEGRGINVPEVWRYQICSATYPLVVNYSTSTATAEEHTFSTRLGSYKSPSSSILQNGYGKNKSSDSKVTYSSSNNSEVGRNTSNEQTRRQNSTPNVFKRTHSQAQPSIPTNNDSETKATNNIFQRSGNGITSESSSLQLPTVAPSQGISRKSTKSKKATKTSQPSIGKSSYPTPSPISTTNATPLASNFVYSAKPTNEKTFSSSSSPTMGFDKTPANVSHSSASIRSTQPPTGLNRYSGSFVDASYVPFDPRSDDPEGGLNIAGLMGLLLGLLLVPFIFVLLVRAYQRHQDQKKASHDLLLFEDYSVVSEDSAILAAMGSRFKRSDDSLMSSDIESLGSAGARISNPRGIIRRIRHAFGKMNEFMEIKDGDSLPEKLPDLKSVESEKSGVSELQRMRQVFHPNEEKNMSEETTRGIMKINPGTVLLPSDDMYLKEFQFSKDDSESTIPVVYQVNTRPASKRKLDVARTMPRTSLDVPATNIENPHLHHNLSKPIPLTNEKIYSDPILSMSSSSSVFSKVSSDIASEVTLKARTRSDRSGVASKQGSEDDFRIVGIAPGSSSSVASREISDESDQSIPFDEPPISRKGKTNQTERKMLSPQTFNKLSDELDAMVGQRVRSNEQTSDYHLVSMNSLSQLSESTASTFSGLDYSVNSTNRTQSIRTTYWPSNGYSMDVLGEPCMHGPVSTNSFRHSLATGSWQNDIDNSSSSGILSDAPSSPSSGQGDLCIETALVQGGSVALISTRSTGTVRAREIDMPPFHAKTKRKFEV